MNQSSLPKTVLEQFPNKTFVETGTARGEGTALALECGFENIITIEANPRTYENACQRFAEHTNVLLALGDSGDVLLKILPPIDHPITFWLDAHWSTGEPPLPNGSSQCPILQDLTAIGKNPFMTNTILIDDISYFRSGGIPQWNMIKLGDIMQAIMDINPQYRISFVDGARENDILIATVPEKESGE